MTREAPESGWERFAKHWPIFWGAVRDVTSLAVGVWILLFRTDASTTLQVIGLACLGVTASGVAQRLLERVLNGNGNGKR